MGPLEFLELRNRVQEQFTVVFGDPLSSSDEAPHQPAFNADILESIDRTVDVAPREIIALKIRRDTRENGVCHFMKDQSSVEVAGFGPEFAAVHCDDAVTTVEGPAGPGVSLAQDEIRHVGDELRQTLQLVQKSFDGRDGVHGASSTGRPAASATPMDAFRSAVLAMRFQ